jgi:hypothetical protein
MKNMKIELIILIVLTLTNCSKSQSWEQNVCDCIEENYNIDNWNYFQELNAFEQELIDREKVDTTIKSKLNLLNELSKSKYADFYKYQISERFETFGRESVEYCIRRELFNRDCQERHWSEKLIHTNCSKYDSRNYRECRRRKQAKESNLTASVI